MKKFLSLALALVMTMSLVTISAGATFTDDSTIEYLEAVDVMTALDIVGGYADGSFNPDGTLTRGAAAKIICNLILGPTIAADLGTNTDPFPDVAYNHTFAGYIAYCANQGIINGYEDGTFRPAGTITGYAFMKMLLGALGYDSDVEGYTGTNWAVNVAAQAKTIGLYDGNEDYVGSQALTREEACLYALNTLTSEVVHYDNKSSVTVGDIVISNNSKAETSGTGTNVTYYKGGGLHTLFMEDNFSKLDCEASETDFEAPAVKWTLSNQKDAIGTYVDPADLVASFEGKVTKDELFDEIGDDADTKVKLYVDGLVNNNFKFADDCTEEDNNDAAVKSGNGTITEVYENGDDSYIIVTVNTYLVKAVADYDADDEVLEVEAVSTGLTLAADELSGEDYAVSDFEEDDYILVTAVKADGKYSIKSVEAAEVVEGEMDRFSTDNYVTVDGAKYSYSVKFGEQATDKMEEVGLVLDTQGNVIHVYVVTEDDSTDYVFVSKTTKTKDGFSDGVLAAAYFADGTYAEITLDQVDDKDAECTYDDADTDYETINTWYTYSQNDDGTYDIDAKATTPAVDAKTTILGGKVNFVAVDKVADTAIKGNSATVFVVCEDGDLSTYTGVKNVPSITSEVAVYITGGDYAEYVFISADEMTFENGSTSVADYVYVINKEESYTTKDDVVIVYNAIVDGEVTTFESTVSGISAGLYDELKTDGDYYKVGTAVKAEADKVVIDTAFVGAVDFDKDVLALGSADYIVTDETVIWNIDLDKEAKELTATAFEKTYKDEYVDGKYVAVVDGDDLVTLYFVEKGTSAAAAVTVATGRPGEASGGTYATAYSDAGVVITGTDITVDKSKFASVTSSSIMQQGDTGNYVVGLAFKAPEGTKSAVVIGKSPVLSVTDTNEFIKVEGVYYLMAYVRVASTIDKVITLAETAYTDTIAWYDAAGDMISVSAADITVTIK